MKTTEPPPFACPWCGAISEAAIWINGGWEDESPRPGGYSVCFSCEAALRFSDDMTLRALTLTESDEMDDRNHAVMHMLMHRLRDMIRERQRRARRNETRPEGERQ